MPRSFLVKKNRARWGSSDPEPQSQENQQKVTKDDLHQSLNTPTHIVTENNGAEFTNPSETPLESEDEEDTSRPSEEGEILNTKAEDIDDFFRRLKAQVSANALANHELLITNADDVKANSEISQKDFNPMGVSTRTEPALERTQSRIEMFQEEEKGSLNEEEEIETAPAPHPAAISSKSSKTLDDTSNVKQKTKPVMEGTSDQPEKRREYMIWRLAEEVPERQGEYRTREENQDNKGPTSHDQSSEQPISCKDTAFRATYGPTIDSLRQQRENAFHEVKHVEHKDKTHATQDSFGAKSGPSYGFLPGNEYARVKAHDVCKPTSLHHTELIRALDPYSGALGQTNCYRTPEGLRSPIFASSPPVDFNLGFPSVARPLDPEVLRCFMYCNGATKDLPLKSTPWPSPTAEVPSSPRGIGWETFLSQSYDACATLPEHLLMRGYIPQSSMGRERKDPQGMTPNRYKCGLCNASFSLQRLLNRHMKTHSFYKRYHCQFCGKGFNDTFDLKRHIRTHTGIKPFKCDRCDKSFTQRCSLEAHLTRVHSVVHKFGFRERREKMFVCEDCGLTFKENQSEFRQHVASHHPETDKILRLRRNGFPA